MIVLQGAVLGDYRLLEVIGRGEMGETWRAQNVREDGVLRAIKVIRTELAAEPGFRQKLLREARVLSTLKHENILEVAGARDGGGQLFLDMELLVGCPVDALLRASPTGLPMRIAAEIVRQGLCGLMQAHRSRVTHRNIRPSSLFATESGRVKLLNFGLNQEETPPPEGVVTKAGNVAYLPPEVARGVAPYNTASDVYAMGVVLYELIHGQLPVEAGPEAPTDRPPPSMTIQVAPPSEATPSIRSDAPLEFGAVLQRAISRSPDGRFESARAFEEALATLIGPPGPAAQDLGRLIIATPREPVPPPAPRKVKKPPEPPPSRTKKSIAKVSTIGVGASAPPRFTAPAAPPVPSLPASSPPSVPPPPAPARNTDDPFLPPKPITKPPGGRTTSGKLPAVKPPAPKTVEEDEEEEDESEEDSEVEETDQEENEGWEESEPEAPSRPRWVIYAAAFAVLAITSGGLVLVLRRNASVDRPAIVSTDDRPVRPRLTPAVDAPPPTPAPSGTTGATGSGATGATGAPSVIATTAAGVDAGTMIADAGKATSDGGVLQGRKPGPHSANYHATADVTLDFFGVVIPKTTALADGGSRYTGLPEDLLREYVSKRLKIIQNCYQHELDENPDVQGRLVVRFTVTKEGRVGDCGIDNDSLHADNVANCIVGMIDAWSFPFHPVEDTSVSFPFVFQPVDAAGPAE